MSKKTAAKKTTKKTTTKKKNCIPKGFKIVRKKGKKLNTRYVGKMRGEEGLYVYAVQARKR